MILKKLTCCIYIIASGGSGVVKLLVCGVGFASQYLHLNLGS